MRREAGEPQPQIACLAPSMSTLQKPSSRVCPSSHVHFAERKDSQMRQNAYPHSKWSTRRQWPLAWRRHLERTKKHQDFSRPSQKKDKLYDAKGKLLPHPRLKAGTRGIPKLHLGVVASADSVLKDSKLRENLKAQYPGVRTIEMEGSGIADFANYFDKGYLVIRGIVDYCDKHKSKEWQKYSSTVAAAFLREMLSRL
jgi:hypothetical protein